MMKLNCLLYLLLIIFINKVSAQTNITPSFKQIKLVEYEFPEGKGKQKLIITDVMEINGYTMHRLTRTYRGICDTTYQLNDKDISTLNEVFNGKKTLGDYQRTNKLPAGQHYGGYPSFLSYIDNSGQTHTLFIVESFMDADFMKVFNRMVRFSFPTTVKYKGDKIIDPALEQKVLSAYKQAKNLPTTEAPPSMMPPPGQ